MAYPAREGSLWKYQRRLPVRNRVSHTDGADGLIKYGLETLLREGGTLQVLDSTNVLGHCHPL